MPPKPLKLSEVRKRLRATLDNVKTASSDGIAKAHEHLRNLESDLGTQEIGQHHEQILGLILSASTSLGVGRMEDTELLLVAAIRMAEKVD